MTDLTFRPATFDDKPRILEIAAQIWEGDDYLPEVLDDWLASQAGALIVAELDARVAGFARYDRSFPGYAWFEGLRMDPAYRGRGIAKAITGRLVEMARADGVERMGLSTYFDNVASQKVTAGFGFAKVAGFAACSGGVDSLRPNAVASTRVEPIPLGEAQAFVAASEALAAGQGFLPHSWRFYPFARGPELALRRMEHRLGIRKGRRLIALLLAGDHTPHGPSSFSLDFLEGEQAALAELVQHALSLMTDEKYVEAMIPCRDGAALPTLKTLQEAGFEPWNDGREDVLVFERDAAIATP